MRNLVLALVIAVMYFTSTSAQFKLYSDGRARLGIDELESVGFEFGGTDDSTTKLRLFGSGIMGGNARVSFGPQFFKDKLHVMVGDAYTDAYGDVNPGILWLHGQSGFCVTANQAASDTVMSYDDYEHLFRFKHPIVSEGVLLSSDARLKENVNHIDGALDALSGLEGVTYNLKARKSPLDGVKPESEEARKCYEESQRRYAELERARTSRLHYGLIAQEVQRVLPELVNEDKNGTLSVDYIGLIPILINAVNELSAEVAELRGEAAPAVNYAPATSGTDETADGLQAEALSQNDPNPFSADTRIDYCLPQGSAAAAIYIYDLQGKQVDCLPISGEGAGSVTVNGGRLAAGMYIYALIADGKELATRKMILTK